MTSNLIIVGQRSYELMINDNWQIEIPVHLRQSLKLSPNDRVKIYLDSNNEIIEEDIDCLIDSLILEGQVMPMP